MNTDHANHIARIVRLKRIAADLGITLVRHPQRDLYPMLAADVPRWEAALRADEEATVARHAAEDAAIEAALKRPT